MMDKKDLRKILLIDKNDDLEECFAKQKAFQNYLHFYIDDFSPIEKQKYIEYNIIAMIDETMEALRETPWKPWKKEQQFNEENFKEELIDIFHFFMNLCLITGMTSKELYTRYNNKLTKNVERQINKY